LYLKIFFFHKIIIYMIIWSSLVFLSSFYEWKRRMIACDAMTGDQDFVVIDNEWMYYWFFYGKWTLMVVFDLEDYVFFNFIFNQNESGSALLLFKFYVKAILVWIGFVFLCSCLQWVSKKWCHNIQDKKGWSKQIYSK
jgi:hypothetical protein